MFSFLLLTSNSVFNQQLFLAGHYKCQHSSKPCSLAATETAVHPHKQKNILNLSPQDRYGYFIRKVADFEEVLIIHENGQYVTLGDQEDQIAIPVWPEKEFAELMLTDDWEGHTVESMNVHDFIEWLDTLEEEGYK